MFPYLEKTWTAPESGEYTVIADYEVHGTGRQLADDEGTAAAFTFLESDVSVEGAADEVVAHETVQDHRAVSENHLPTLAEKILLAIGARKVAGVLGGVLGLLAAGLVRSILEDVIDIVDEQGQDFERIYEDGRVRATFRAESGGSYRIRFLANGSFWGGSHFSNSGFRAALSARYDLRGLFIEPASEADRSDDGGDGDRAENPLTVTKEGAAENPAAFMLVTNGEIEHGESSEATIEGQTALDHLGPERGTDQLRFAGEIENFVLKGDATVTLNGERVDPTTLGFAEELTNSVAVESTGQGLAYYGITVSGPIAGTERGLAEATIRGSSAVDRVGPERGVDRFRFSGEILDFLLRGEANVYVNGERVDPDAIGV